jgi:lipopolysaccharide heptosyltransferase II
MKTQNKSILVVLIAGIGDLVLASKSIRAIRNGLPDADIHLLTSSEAAPIASNYSYLNHVWGLPIRELRKNKSQIITIIKQLRKLMKIEFAIAVNLYRLTSCKGAIKMGFLFLLLNARIKLGHHHKGLGLLLNRKANAEIFQNRHFADAMMDIVQIVGGKADNKGIEVFWDKKTEEKWEHFISNETNEMKKIRIGINPGAGTQHKRWNPDHYAFVADHLIESCDAKIILFGGPGEETIANHIQNKMKNDAMNLSGKLTLNELTYIVSQLDLLVTNDSGPMHIGAAIKTPLVAIFGPEIPLHTRPYTTDDLYRVVHKYVDCRPCIKKNCDRPVCLDLIKPEEVIEKCLEMLKNGRRSSVKEKSVDRKDFIGNLVQGRRG